MSNDKEIVVSNLWDTLIELPIEYKVNGQLFYLYPPSLGSTMLINSATNRVKEQSDLVYEMLAICSFENRADARKRSALNARIEELKQSSVDELIHIYMMFNEWGKDQEKFICENGHKSSKDAEYCETCSRNIKGLHKDEVKAINIFKDKVEALADFLKNA